MADQAYLTGKGSSYYQMKETLAIGKDNTRSIHEIPQCDHTFEYASGKNKYEEFTLTSQEQTIGMEQMQWHVKQIREGGGMALGNITYLEQAMKTQLANAEGWQKEQK